MADKLIEKCERNEGEKKTILFYGVCLVFVGYKAIVAILSTMLSPTLSCLFAQETPSASSFYLHIIYWTGEILIVMCRRKMR